MINLAKRPSIIERTMILVMSARIWTENHSTFTSAACRIDMIFDTELSVACGVIGSRFVGLAPNWIHHYIRRLGVVVHIK